MSLLLHGANAALLFLVVQGLTGARGKSFAVAALFAVHPLHVESVAWVAERKDVLSALFWMLTLAAYLRYVRRPGAGRLLLVALLFALGLMAKPMLVTLPFVLLLLDYWPLGRFRSAGGPGAADSRSPLRGLLREKAPLFLLAAGSSAVTLIAQSGGGALQLMERQHVWSRAANAVLSLESYVVKAFWPANLVVFYPHPAAAGDWPGGALWGLVAASVLVAAVTGLAVLGARSRPAASVGWFWFAGSLVPVIGLVQVGAQAMADRYTYLPLAGLFIAVVWSVASLTRALPHPGRLQGAALAAVLLALVPVTRAQTGLWRDSSTLFGHCATVYPHNPTVQYLYASALLKDGKADEALARAVQAVRLGLDEQQVRRFGTILESRGMTGEAAIFYAEVLRVFPGADVRYSLANCLARMGRFEEAIAAYREVLRMNPGHGAAHNNLAGVLARAGRDAEAIGHAEAALAIDPANAEAHNNLGVLLARAGRLEEAIAHYRTAASLTPDSAATQRNLADALRAVGRAEESLLWRQRAERTEADLAQRRKQLRAYHGPIHPDGP